jgi:hypothetical protein
LRNNEELGCGCGSRKEGESFSPWTSRAKVGWMLKISKTAEHGYFLLLEIFPMFQALTDLKIESCQDLWMF